MTECSEKNRYSNSDSVEQLLIKNQTMVEKLGIVISTVEGQLAVMGHDVSSFFDSITRAAITPCSSGAFSPPSFVDR